VALVLARRRPVVQGGHHPVPWVECLILGSGKLNVRLGGGCLRSFWWFLVFRFGLRLGFRHFGGPLQRKAVGKVAAVFRTVADKQ